MVFEDSADEPFDRPVASVVVEMEIVMFFRDLWTDITSRTL